MMMKTFLPVIMCLLLSLSCCSNSNDNGTNTPKTLEEPHKPAAGDYVSMQNGKLYTPEGEELALWGVNLQPCLSWEYRDRLRERGIPETAEALKQVARRNLDDLVRLKVSVIRCHLTPADFTDADGNLVETPYLEVLDYMIAEAAERGIYVVLAFINHMGGGYVPESIFMNIDREEWIFNKEAVEKSKNYINQLLIRENRYAGGKTYARQKNMALWEIVNEPGVYSYNAIKSHAAYYNDFKSWASQNGRQDNAEAYAAYRERLVRDYIDGMYDVIRNAGARQPIIWSHNWHRYRNGNLDVFKAALASKADGVSFCNYPGQDLVGQDYWTNPKNLTGEDFSGWFNRYYDDENGYGWARLPEYSGKAKTVYEFETFFNQSAYLYPIQAQYFRALGVQSATMWTYTVREAAPWHSGSHFLSLTCTPAKAASFIVAGEIFKTTPLGQAYDRQVNSQRNDNVIISRNDDLAIYSSTDKFYHSGDATNIYPQNISDEVDNIVGVGSSPLVDYSGTGIYFIDDRGDELFITIEPNHKRLQEPWDSRAGGLISELDYNTPNTMSIRLADWKYGDYTLYRISNGKREKVCELNSPTDMSLVPGDYVVVR